MFLLHKLGTRLGVHIVPVHYYSALPDVVDLERTMGTWARKSTLPGIAADLDEQVRNLQTICLPYHSEYAGNRAYRYAVEHAFGPGYGYIEAQALHAVVRHFKPSRIVEVGSGVSTYCMLEALRLNQVETADRHELTCIEPSPSPRLRQLKDIVLIDKHVQAVPFDSVFSQLSRHDLLFIDSSHAVKTGSDVNYLILEVLPRLRPGVIVHFHDIYLPYDYSPDVLRTFFHWSETSLLRAFLINNERVKILFCQSHLHHERPDVLKEVFADYNRRPDRDGLQASSRNPFDDRLESHFPSSTYLQIH